MPRTSLQLTLVCSVLIAAGTLFLSCSNEHTEVMKQHPNGNVAEEYVLKSRGGKDVVAGINLYHDNGKLKVSQTFTDDKPSGTWEFYYPSGSIFSRHRYQSDKTPEQWEFFSVAGEPLMAGAFDSVTVIVDPITQLPSTVAFCVGDTMRVREYYNDFSLKSQGLLVSGLRDGSWSYFFPNGKLQTEAIFINGVENGRYVSYRSNGIPYFRGVYINGKRAGVWEFYDEEGNISGTKNFD